MIKFNSEHKRVIDDLLLQISGVIPGKMFGYPAYYTNKKLFACLYEDGVGLKVSEGLAKQLVDEEVATYFQPLGKRKMREWIYLTREKPLDYYSIRDLFENSVKYVSSLKEK